MFRSFGKGKDIAGKPALRRPSPRGRATAGGCSRREKKYRETFKRRQKAIRKGITLYGSLFRGALQLKILVGAGGQGEPDRAGGHPLQRVVPEGGTVGAGGHDPFLGTDHLAGVQLPPSGAVGAAGLYGRLKQVYGGSTPSRFLIREIILHSAGLFHCFFVPRTRSEPGKPATRPRRPPRK